MKRMMVLSVVCMMLVAATVALSGCPATMGGWPVLKIGNSYNFVSPGNTGFTGTVLSQNGQWVTCTNDLIINLSNVVAIR